MSEKMMGAVSHKNREEKTPRLEAVMARSNEYEDPVANLAQKEDLFRTEYLGQENPRRKQGGSVWHIQDSFQKIWAFLSQKKRNSERLTRDRVANAFSDEALKTIEAEQAKWIDDMTGLKNKNAYNEEVPRFVGMEHRRYRRYQSEQGEEERRATQGESLVPHCSVLMIDFDHFKVVNDIYGHLAGDQALKQMAHIIQEVVRKTDLVYRYGGEEFVVFLPDTASSGAKQLAEKIRERLESGTIDIVDTDGKAVSLKKTVSIGFVSTDKLSEWDGMKDTDVEEFADQIVKKADVAMYSSKQTGRNRVTEYEEGMQKIAGEK